MKKQIRTIGVLATCAIVLCGCSSNEDIDETNMLVDLHVNTSIAMTRAASSGVITSDYFNAETIISVFANSANTNNTSNNHAKFKCSIATSSSNNTWIYDGADKIQLSAEAATIYAIYPSTLTVTTSSAITGTTTASGLQLLTGSSETDAAKITAKSSYDSQVNITAAPGETDYMYATDPSNVSSQPKANNGKATSEPDNALTDTVNLKMNHAMAMVSFKVYNDGTYTHNGKLTKIQLANASGKLLKTGTATMKISDGTITPQDGDGKIIRYIYTEGGGQAFSGYTLPKSTTSPANNPAFSMLVYPESAADKSTIKAIFTVDNTDYPVSLPSSSQVWEKGKNYIYTVKLNGKEMGVGTVSIVTWQEESIGPELIPIV